MKPNLTKLLALLAFVLFSVAPSSRAVGPTLTNAILFVTQVPMPVEVNANQVSNVVVSVATPLGNHLADTAHAGRGGDLWLRLPNGTMTNLTRGAGYGVNGAQHTNGIAVRQPAMHWSGTKAIFSMVVGAPRFSGDTNKFFWQLYEVSGLPNGPYSITQVSNQPTNYNNVSPCYGTDERVIFTCDRPRDGAPHLYPQLDEYNDIPTVTGLWSFSPTNALYGDLFLLNHTPSGAFNPIIDSFGRLLFTRWDHLVQDRNATGDRLPGTANATTNGTGNFSDESPLAVFNSLDRSEIFPEPRTFDATNLAALGVNGQAFNSFFPWQITEDGTDEEVLNHIGRHELVQSIIPSFPGDPNLVTNQIATRWNSNFIGNFFYLREHQTNAGVYYGVDGPDFGTHGSGQIVTLTGPLGMNPSNMFLTYITAKNGGSVYRNPTPMSDGTLVAVHTANSGLDSNTGTATNPVPAYNYRLKLLTNSGGFLTNGTALTPGSTNPVTYWNGSNLVTYTGTLWELDPVEVRGHTKMNRIVSSIQPLTQQVIDEAGVDTALLQKYLRANNLALLVSYNVTRRDHADRQQPFNLRIAGTTNVTWGQTNTGVVNPKLYDISHIQFLQADQRRGLTMSSNLNAPPIPGRRVLPTLMHDPAADNTPTVNAPLGAVKLGADGSFAAFVPARRAMTWQLTGTNNESVVKERYWVTFAPGEIRTCKNCHGINTIDQAGNPPPANKPQALADLLAYWKSQNTPTSSVQNNGNTNYLAITFKRVLGQTNLTHTVELSSDLTNWLGGSSYSTFTNTPVTTNTTEVSRTGVGTETIRVRDNTPLTAPVTNHFLRVRVTSPAP